MRILVRTSVRALLGVLLIACGGSATSSTTGNGTFEPTATNGNTTGDTTSSTTATTGSSTGKTTGKTTASTGATTGSTTSTAGSTTATTGATTGTTTDSTTGTTGEPPPFQDGTWAHPYLPALPSTVSGDTSQVTTNDALSYSCAPSTNEGGPEIVYRVHPTTKGILTATLNDTDGDQVDIDVNLLSAAEPSACLVRNNKSISSLLQADTDYWIVADTWENASGTALAGSFTLTLAFQEVTDPGPGQNGCPGDMVRVTYPSGDFCMDLFEAPNKAGQKPLVMYNMIEGTAWCAARGKRLCFDDEWTYACAGPQNWSFPYGNTFDEEKCNVDKTWITFSETKIAMWPSSASSTDIESYEQLITKAHGLNATAADEIEKLYQGEGGGARATCQNVAGVYDLTGSVEEWTKRRDGGFTDSGVPYTGNLKGRFWDKSDGRTCQQNLRGVKQANGTITGHADGMKFYEIGFRCCQNPE